MGSERNAEGAQTFWFGDLDSGEPLWVEDTPFTPDADTEDLPAQLACGCTE